MTPIPVNPKIVIHVDEEGTVRASANNIGSDLEVVVSYDRVDFNYASRGVPYTGTIVLAGLEKS